MNITNLVRNLLIACVIITGGAAWYFGYKAGSKQEATAAPAITTQQAALPQPPPYYPFLVAVKYTYRQEPGYPQNTPPVSIVTWYVQSQKQPSRNKLLAALGEVTQSPKQLERLVSVDILAVSRIENKAWWPGNYTSIDALAPEDNNEPPHE